ncbi:cytochrome b-c1 complex subunit 8 [Eremomyces bilateralis CBS 781.70]|uniref:Cytochrome b-c1 complex subunit 8 n=1 Tax=Eremomyces bilateralis CBS 781.70 TaxID=1392243 RepID=A0A6G1GAX7_9PEZI|nr:cytochrome b-c1 complex subunit 8 [Eremomyces bilateralis CBS 781.70]KAF1815225.1 cytochrome b-c1 complex subunit 8 [Eremomyces bilateralis CBS 781.70]
MGGIHGGMEAKWLGWWGSLGSMSQKGVTTYTVAPNRMRPLAGTLHAAFFNTFRRSRNQILYVLPPFIVGYYAMDWATKKNEWLNSKEGRAATGEEE